MTNMITYALDPQMQFLDRIIIAPNIRANQQVLPFVITTCMTKYTT